MRLYKEVAFYVAVRLFRYMESDSFIRVMAFIGSRIYCVLRTIGLFCIEKKFYYAALVFDINVAEKLIILKYCNYYQQY